MKISILGGGGFLGRKVAAKLAKDGVLGGRKVTALTLFDVAEPPKPDAPFPGQFGWRRHRQPARQRHPRRDRRHLPPRRGGECRGGGGLRPGPAGKHPRHRRGDRSLPRAWVPAARGVHQFGGQLQRRPEFRAARQHPPDSGQQLRRPEGSPRSCSWPTPPAAASSMPSRCGCPRSSSGRGARTRQPARFSPPLCGSRCWALDTELPVADDFAVWVCSPRRAVDWLLHAAAMDTSKMGLDRSIDPPGISTTVAHLLQALEELVPRGPLPM